MEALRVSREVITDLLVLCDAGEASEDSQQLVKEYLDKDPELARLVEKLKHSRFHGEKCYPEPEVAVKSLQRTKRLMKQQTSVLALAILFSLMPFGFIIRENRMNWLLIRDAPIIGGAWLMMGLVLWIIYAVMRRKLKVW
jgi:hypothetical protein